MINLSRLLRHLLDLVHSLSRFFLYFLSLILIILLEMLLFALGDFLLPVSIDRLYLAYAASVLVVLGYLLVREYWYQPSKLTLTLNEIIHTETDLAFLKTKLAGAIASAFQASRVDFLLVADFAARPAESLLPDSPAHNRYAKLEKRLHQIHSPLVADELKDPADLELFRELNLNIILPLKVGSEDIGLLILGPRLHKKIYLTRHLKFLAGVSSQLALALKHAESYRQIQDFNRVLETKIIDRTRDLEASQAAQLRLKDEFVYIATHDIATPVAAITGFTELINRAELAVPPEITKYLAAIGEASSRLKVLVNDLLQIARSESGTIKVALTQVDASQIIASAVRVVAPQASQNKISLTLNLGPDNRLQADPVKLAEVFENILSNGVKYNRQGGTLNVASSVIGNKYVIEFSDTGIGIPKSEHAKVFTKFFRSESALAREHPGTGLGLFVARMLTEKMGGTISFTSTENQGTTFRLEFNR